MEPIDMMTTHHDQLPLLDLVQLLDLGRTPHVLGIQESLQQVTPRDFRTGGVAHAPSFFGR